jgi:hypothetical protein
MSAPAYDLTSWPREIDAVLERTGNPRHRAMLLNMREHLLLESSGRWREVLVPRLMVDEPAFHLALPADRWHIEGKPAVADFYHNLWDKDPSRSGGTAIVHEGEVGYEIAVNDHRVIGASLLANQWWGRELLESRHAERVDPDAFYIETYHMVYVFEYGAGDVLLGENTFSGGDSFLYEIDKNSIVTPEDAADVLAEYLAKPPSL